MHHSPSTRPARLSHGRLTGNSRDIKRAQRHGVNPAINAYLRARGGDNESLSDESNHVSKMTFKEVITIRGGLMCAEADHDSVLRTTDALLDGESLRAAYHSSGPRIKPRRPLVAPRGGIRQSIKKGCPWASLRGVTSRLTCCLYHPVTSCT